MKSKKYINIDDLPVVIGTPCFLWFVEYYMLIFFKANGREHWLKRDGSYEKWLRSRKGYGRWLKEYQRMDAQGLFTPEQLQELYKPILMGTSKLSFIYREAVNYICSQAQRMAEAFLTQQVYEIRVITGAIALDDNDFELTGLSLNYALKTCKAMNKEAEEDLFRVYSSRIKRPINNKLYKYPTF